jgi:hypothetical protein
MAVTLNRYVLTQTYTLTAGTIATPTAGEIATGGFSGYGTGDLASGEALWPTTFLEGTAIILDSGTPSALYTALNGAGVLRAYVQGQDDVGHAALSN